MLNAPYIPVKHILINLFNGDGSGEAAHTHTISVIDKSEDDAPIPNDTNECSNVLYIRNAFRFAAFSCFLFDIANIDTRNEFIWSEMQYRHFAGMRWIDFANTKSCYLYFLVYRRIAARSVLTDLQYNCY